MYISLHLFIYLFLHYIYPGIVMHLYSCFSSDLIFVLCVVVCLASELTVACHLTVLLCNHNW